MVISLLRHAGGGRIQGRRGWIPAFAGMTETFLPLHRVDRT